MQSTSRSKNTWRGGWFPIGLCLLLSIALVLGLCSGVVSLRSDGTRPNIALSTWSGTFSTYGPGEQWGGANPAEHCVSCTATDLIGMDTARSIQSHQSVAPATGDFSSDRTLFSLPTAAGTFGVSLSYDQQRSFSEALDPSAKNYTYSHPGPFGWGWQSSLNVSLINNTPTGTITVNEANGSQVRFADIGTAAVDIHSDGCPAGDYQDFQKYTVPGSTAAFCAPSRVDAQVGTNTALGSYQFDQSGGSTVQIFNSMGELTAEGNLQNPRAIGFRYGVTPGTTGCPTTGEANCTFETDNVSGRHIVAEVDGYGLVQEVWDPMSREYQMTYTDGQGNLNTVMDPLGDTTHYGYAVTNPTSAYKHEVTSITDPNGYAEHVTYVTGMVTSTSDPYASTTHYSYNNTHCGTLTGCFQPGTSQTTTISYPDGETDVDSYFDSVLTVNCYGGNTVCSGALTWAFNYNFPTPTNQNGWTVETVVMPKTSTEVDPTITTDAAGNVVSYTDPNGNTSNTMYNDSGSHDLNELCWSAAPGVAVPTNATCTRAPAGSTSYSYDPNGELLSTTDPLGNATRSGYYNNGLVCWTALPTVAGGGSCTNGGSTPNGAPNGSTAYVYDSYSDNTGTYVAWGKPTVSLTSDAYNTDGQQTYAIPPDGRTHGAAGANPYETATAYYQNGRVQTVTSPQGRVTSYTYDADGHVLTESDPAGITTTTYDPDGRTCWTYRGTSAYPGAICTSGAAGPSGSTSTTAYLATTSAPVTVYNQNGHATSYQYSDPQYPTKATKVTDSMGTQIQYALYNAYGDTCLSGPVNPGTSCASYVNGDTWISTNAEGQVAQTTDPSGVVTTYTYSNPDFPTQATASKYGTRTTSYTYDADGRQVSTTDAAGNVISTAYYADSRLCWSGPVNAAPTCSSPPAATGTSTYSYYTTGKLKQMIDNYGVTGQVVDTYIYDADGNLLSATDDNRRQVSYAYNTAAEVTCIAYPVKSSPNCANSPSSTNSVVDQHYNGAGQLSATTDWLGNRVQYTTYTPQGQVGLITYPPSTSESLRYGYDNVSNLKSATYAGPALGSVANTYTYNADEQLSAVTGLGGFSSPADTYNTYKRVGKATDPTSPTTNTVDSYTYNNDGTVSSIGPAVGTTAYYSYNGVEELTSQTGAASVAYSYTADGQRCSSTPGSSATACTSSSSPSGSQYDGWTKLGELCWSGTTTSASASCSTPPAGATTYSYNGQGLRMKETPHSGSALTFTWNTVTGGGTPLNIDSGSTAYLYGPLMFGGTALVEQINFSTPTHPTASFLGSTPSGVQAMFSSAGALQEKATYTTYGKQVIQYLASGATASAFGFQGSYTDASGLIYLINRYYTPTTDQFLSVDPMLAETGQPYAFTGDDPLNFEDPLGLVLGKYYWNHTKWNIYKGTTYTKLCVGNQTHCGGPSCHGGPCYPSMPKPSVNWTALPAYAAALDNWFNEVNAAAAASYAAEHPSPSPIAVVGHAISSATSTVANDIKSWPGAGSQNPVTQWLRSDSTASCVIQGVEVAGATLATGGGDAVFLGAGGAFSTGTSDAIAGGIGFSAGCWTPPSPEDW